MSAKTSKKLIHDITSLKTLKVKKFSTIIVSNNTLW